jgi:phosphoribosylformylglycinamidine (FGAM) synthase-like enzyme
VGERRAELGGSEAAWILGQREAGEVPSADASVERACAKAVLALTEAGKVHAATDVSSGGLFTALCEMMLGAWGQAELGLTIDLRQLEGASDFERLFSETGAYLLEMDAGETPAALDGVPHVELGLVTPARELRIRGVEGEIVWGATELEAAWRRSFARFLE